MSKLFIGDKVVHKQSGVIGDVTRFSEREGERCIIVESAAQPNLLYISPIDDWEKIKNNIVKALYLCDRRACASTCDPNCFHTSDIRHARNFRLLANGDLYEVTGTTPREEMKFDAGL